GIYGGGFLLSERAAAERAAAPHFFLADRGRRRGEFTLHSLLALRDETWGLFSHILYAPSHKSRSFSFHGFRVIRNSSLTSQ
ncbi:MAG: hypothetical protein IK084_05590, partial [Bacteroidaceae bacterium]|nr:hypothetical protein [Bacteroidaceae bacterium]